jgi:hypothetical protein
VRGLVAQDICRLKMPTTIAVLPGSLKPTVTNGAQEPKGFGSSTEVPRKSLTQNEVQALM